MSNPKFTEDLSNFNGEMAIVPSDDSTVFYTGGGWGDTIGYMKYPYEVHGHKSIKPVRGDVLISSMQSGKRLVSIFQEVRPCGDPWDMFFATVEPIDYFEDVKFKIIEPTNRVNQLLS